MEDKIIRLALNLALPEKEETSPQKPPQAGDWCPKCRSERLDYDGTLTLVCPRCGVLEGGCFT
ncbi:MAG: hypothetical protein ANABAC_1697 [Anaerolineae bacterium]|nr:MAG: hypothetical protein ANABAC_1697 [Anaerolineae bacterium]